MFIRNEDTFLPDSTFLQNESLPVQLEYSRGPSFNLVQLAIVLLMAVFQTLYYVGSAEDSRKLLFKMGLGSAAVYLCCISSAVNLHISHVLQDQQLNYRSAYSSAQMLINVGVTLLLLLAQIMVIEQRTQGFYKTTKPDGNKVLMVFIIISNTILSTIAIVNTSAKIHSDVFQLLY
ncbi:unnamed protein product [Allacma fusca]|uniref:Uncharacterized protein n=1 Tax=Allacma fusca TaxID=39272 RepID=A0A8J2PUW6_9HEXA|nr:unnamed protein product [Allacma fusca]